MSGFPFPGSPAAGSSRAGPSHSTSSSSSGDFRRSTTSAAAQTWAAHTDDVRGTHEWLSSFLESVKGVGVRVPRGQPRCAAHSPLSACRLRIH